jgi:hypothetical protein
MAQHKWQPVMLVLDERLECGVCGALAIFVVLLDRTRGAEGKEDFDYTAWCQFCWVKAEEEDENAPQ